MVAVTAAAAASSSPTMLKADLRWMRWMQRRGAAYVVGVDEGTATNMDAGVTANMMDLLTWRERNIGQKIYARK